MQIHNKDDIEFVTEFPCFLGHPVYTVCTHTHTQTGEQMYILTILENNPILKKCGLALYVFTLPEKEWGSNYNVFNETKIV